MKPILMKHQKTKGLIKLINKLPNLNTLDVKFNNNVDNSVLEAALTLSNAMLLRCSDTKVDATKFVYDHPTTTKHVLDRDLFSYSLDRLRFETFASKRLDRHSYADDDYDDIWDEDNGFFYMGSEFEDSDMEAYFPVQDETRRPRPAYDDFDQVHSDTDDFDDFINNDETEMYNELDEY